MSGAHTYHLHGVAHTLRDLVAERRLHLLLGDVLERWQHRVLDLGLDSHLDNARRVLRQLCRDELQDLLLADEVSSLLALADFLEALVCEGLLVNLGPSRLHNQRQLTLLVELFRNETTKTGVEAFL